MLLQRLATARGRVIQYRNGEYESTTTTDELLQRASEVSLDHLPSQAVVAAALGNSIQTLILMVACLQRQLTIVPLNPALSHDEINEIFAITKPSLFLVSEAAHDNYKHIIPQPTIFPPIISQPNTDNTITTKRARLSSSPNDCEIDEYPWTILFTSGTSSGSKKGVPRSAGATLRGVAMHQSTLNLGQDDVFVAFWPLHGISSFFFSFYVMVMSGTVILMDDALCPPERRIQHIQRLLSFTNNVVHHKPTFLTGPPSLFFDLQSSSQHNSLRQILLSGAPCSSNAKFELRNKLHCKIHCAYGSTECGLLTLLVDDELSNKKKNDDDDDAQVAESVGREAPGVRLLLLRCDDDGSSVLGVDVKSCPMFMCESGYMTECKQALDAIAFSEIDGRRVFITGDVAKMDANSHYITLLGRVDDLVLLPLGFKFYPAEVEVTLRNVLEQVFVFACEDGKIACAFVAPKSMHATMETSLRKAVCEAKLVDFKRPSVFIGVESIDQLPLTSTRKVKRKALKEWWQGRMMNNKE